MKKNAYVLDTSVLIHDPKALYKFKGSTVAIPIYVVMELDGLKNSKRRVVAASARIASKGILKLRGRGDLQNTGTYDEESQTNFVIIADGKSGVEHIKTSKDEYTTDILILRSASYLRDSGNFKDVILVTKDINLRLQADFAKVTSEDYHSDRVELSELYTGTRTVHSFDAELVKQVYLPDSNLKPSDFGLTEIQPNEFVHFINEKLNVLTRFDPRAKCLMPLPKKFGKMKIQPRNDEQRMALELMLDPDVQLVTLVGKAGTGKTFLALAAAIGMLGRANYERILLSKPVVAMGADVGYLPGDFSAKMQPWMQSFFDNLDQLMTTDSSAKQKGASRDVKTWEYLFETNVLQIQGIHTIRGRSISKAFMVIDEAQNLTPHEVKTIITRAAIGTKIILCGDPYQVDNHFLDSHTNGLVYAMERLKASNITGAVFFQHGERSPLAELAATLL